MGPKSVVVATSAQALLGMRYFASERKDGPAFVVMLTDVGMQIAEMVHGEAVKLYRQSDVEVN